MLQRQSERAGRFQHFMPFSLVMNTSLQLEAFVFTGNRRRAKLFQGRYTRLAAPHHVSVQGSTRNTSRPYVRSTHAQTISAHHAGSLASHLQHDVCGTSQAHACYHMHFYLPLLVICAPCEDGFFPDNVPSWPQLRPRPMEALAAIISFIQHMLRHPW
jgi:hypothetical protein